MTLSRSDGQSARPLAPSPIQRPAELESHLAEPRPAPRFYKPELDVLRFFAFLFVFLHHTVPNEAADYATKLRPDIARNPFDADARMLFPWHLRNHLRLAGLRARSPRYYVFLPRHLKRIWWTERYLRRVPLGAQYYVWATKTASASSSA